MTVTIAGCLGNSEESPDGDGNQEQSSGDEGGKRPAERSSDVPDSFDNQDWLRTLSREYLEALAAGKFQTASE